MNAALQCLIHTPFIQYLFKEVDLLNFINTDNPLGSKGKMIKAFKNLFDEYFEQSERALNPLSFKRILRKYMPTFEGYEQHDSQEFISQLMDIFHEDLNRIVDKPFVEKAEGKKG